MNQPPNLSTSTDWPVGAIPQSWVESLFKKMAFTYGAKFSDQWRGLDTTGVKRHWAEELGALSTEQLCRGVAALAKCSWPPTLPEFMKLCRPMVDPVVAYHEAIEQGGLRDRGEPDVWSCPAVFWAWKRIGAHDFAHQAYATLKPRWEAALNAEMAKEAPDPVPPQALALPAPGRGNTDAGRARQLLAGFVVGTRQHAASLAADPKRWARDIMARRDRGELLEIIQIADAEKALGLR